MTVEIEPLPLSLRNSSMMKDPMPLLPKMRKFLWVDILWS